ncbi:hypothetical protein QG041_07600 [Kingella kingae]|uniref:hypothetical protein n=1 Tax=Kingella kingae TaxID=504 RepID=UPI0002F241FB|nr:hypothetical protein [Kingella kingae]MDK4527805.1 hypothetical protein [Kingella kingae]MDK4529484.1 hypothetical protein [Kingella kingae]MDK4542542.1 hypothetical protein [Kingella kingae]MDK4561896.1 hypothetical protein [Kingella kingae]MDK4569171.1 hypothetical protein [Kingella kingae]
MKWLAHLGNPHANTHPCHPTQSKPTQTNQSDNAYPIARGYTTLPPPKSTKQPAHHIK